MLRNWAADCYIKANRMPSEAAELLLAEINGKFPLAKPADYCKKWGECRIATGGVADAPRSGRPKQLTAGWIDQIITALSQGYIRIETTGPKRVPFRTWSQFCSWSPIARACLEATKVTQAHLLRACQLSLPTLKRVKIQLKVWLAPATKAARVAASTKLLAKPAAWFNSVVWLDAKTLYINPKNTYAWVNTAAMSPHDLVREDKRFKARGKELIKLKFYIAVNALCGPVALVWVTGTTGLKCNRLPIPFLPYQVITADLLHCRICCSRQSQHCCSFAAVAPLQSSSSIDLLHPSSAASPRPSPYLVQLH